MNFLAHSYLSFTEAQIAGQFLQDFIRNKERFYFPEDIRQGIMLHRAIDTFTDAHPEMAEARLIFRPLVRLYGGAFVDVAMDYFLANSLSEAGLKQHTQKVYAALRRFRPYFPTELIRMCNSMENSDWLYHYREESGMQKALQNVLHRAKYLEKDLPVFEVFLQNKKQLRSHFERFFPDLKAHARKKNEDFQKDLER